MPSEGPQHEVAVVGAGFSGIGAAIKLSQAGFTDYTVLEAGSGVGGAWHWNRYPGVAVDIPSFSYQFSFEKSRNWSRVYASGDELRAYAEHCVRKYDVEPRIRLDTPVTGAEFDEANDLWRLRTPEGEVTAQYVVGATGVFSQPQPPDIPGLDEFAGHVMHTARWDHGYDLGGKRVALIGTGASAVQVVPSIAPEVAQLTVFQRTPIWCLPRPDADLSGTPRKLLRLPGAVQAARAASQVYVEVNFPIPAHFHDPLPIAAIGERQARNLLAHQVHDPDVRAKLTPRYALGCKRPGFSNEYLPTFNRENVHLETNPIEAVTSGGVRTADGAEHAADTLVLATGFKVFEPGNMPAYPVAGTGGTDLESWWDENRYQAYEGVSVPGFPNLFVILGPYGYNGSSYFNLIEHQSRHIVRCLRHARERGATRVEVTPEANERYFAEHLGRRRRQVFFQGKCEGANSYYFDRHGDVPFRAATTVEVAWRSGHFPLTDYRFASVA